MATSTEANKTLVRRFIEEFKNRANHAVVDQLMTADFMMHFPLPGLPPGRDGMKGLGQQVASALPDVHVEVQDMIAEGDRVVERTVARGTHRGVFFGVPPTGKAVTWTETHVYRIKDGRIAELWSEVNMLGILVQLGAVQLPGV